MKKFVRRSYQGLKTGWYLWMFPVIAVGITGYLVYDYYRGAGPRIQVMFEDGVGLEAEKTAVKFRGVTVGMVQEVFISEDSKVVAEILLHKDVAEFAVIGSRFSLVKPRVNFQGISGLETLFEGAYIAVLPGDPKGQAKQVFIAQAIGSTDPLDDTSPYLLATDNAESVSQGDSVTYRGIKIGTVSKLNFDRPAREVLVRINIDNKYARLIRTNTVFWRKAGIQADLGLFHSQIKINSMDAIMNGGIELATPDQAGPRAKVMHRFALTGNAPKDYNKWRPALDGSAPEPPTPPPSKEPPRPDLAQR